MPSFWPVKNRISQSLWLETSEILQSVFNRMYAGPPAWLVRCNLVIGCLALTPVFLFVVLLLAASPLSRTLGDWINLPAAIAALLLEGIGEAPFIVVIPFLFALIFLRRLLQSQEIPPNVKRRTAFFVMGALAAMIVSAGLAGRFR